MFNSVVNPAVIAELHDKTLHLLQTVGVSFGSQQALALFRRHGFQAEGSWVRFKPAQIEQALASAPPAFDLRGLGESASFGRGQTNLAACSGAVEIYEQGGSRPPTREDFIKRAQLDAVSPVINIGNMDCLFVPELGSERALAVKSALTLTYNPKPLIGSCSTEQSSRQCLELAKAFYQGAAPHYLLGIGNMLSPLQYTEENLGAFNAYAEYEQPVVVACCSIPGVTSPVTLGGTLVQNNAEILAGIVYLQLLKPGLPVIYGNSTFGVDMHNANTAAGAFETFLILSHAAALASFYKLPSRVSGSLNDAKQLDYQAGMETSMGLLHALAAGVDLIFHACGGMGALTQFSFAKYMLDEEAVLRIRDMGRRDLLYGLDTSMQDLISVREGVNFITCRQTYREFKKEHYDPKLVNRESARQWRKTDCPSLEGKAEMLLKQRLEAYEPPKLSFDQQKLLAAALDV